MKTKITLLITICMFIGFTGCTQDNKAVAIKYNTDACDNCKMTIVDNKFACEFKTNKGRAYKFDDLSCLVEYIKGGSNTAKSAKHFFVCDYITTELVPVEKISIIRSDEIRSPMRGSMASFINADSANYYKKYYKAVSLNWADLLK